MRITEALDRGGHGLPRSLAGFLSFLTAAASLINESVDQITGGSAIDCDLTVYKSEVTTGGTAGAETMNVAAGDVVGQRKLIELTTLTNGSDSVLLSGSFADASGSALTSVTLDAADEFHLMEWNGSAWQTVHTTATETV